uniref:AF-9 ANC1 homology domain-containing protein n=1 Tax=Nothoprocta perdicaria TaxID=30464 RepID=A0A8C6ZQ23_NOTPE
MKDLHSDDNEDESDEADENDNDSELERPVMSYDEVKSPIKQSKSDKQIKNGECDKIVNLIEETGHFHITNTTFDFDLCSLDKTTVRKLQSYLETSGTS